MAAIFPLEEWVSTFKDKLNSDEKYARVASKWEGDLLFDIEPSGALEERTLIYIDLWHGKCPDAYVVEEGEEKEAAFVLKAPYDNFVRVLTGELDPMVAMMTRKLKVAGSMTYMMRNVPTVLEFVRCAQDITTTYVGA